jgi:hypothetical protein
MVLWTIYVLPTEEADVKEITIDSEKTFGEFRRMVSTQVGINSADLILTGQQEYDAKFDSQKLSSISGIYDQITLYAVYQVGGGKLSI